MTIATQNASINILTNGVQTNYDFNFIIPYQVDGVTPAVKVFYTSTTGLQVELSYPSDFTITGVNLAGGGTVVMSSAPASGGVITIVRGLEYTQSTAVANQAFLPHTVEQVADKLEMQLQQINTQLAETLRGPRGAEYLPFTQPRGNTLVGFDAVGVPYLYPIGSAGGSVNAANVSFIQAGAGAVIRTAQNKMRERVTPEDFGAVGDGVTNDTLAVQRAIDYFNGYGGVVEFTGGYLVSNTIVVDRAITLRGAGWGTSAGGVPASFIKWGGVAGLPMILLTFGFGPCVENIRLIGNSAAKPSALIEISQGAGSNINNKIDHVWFGSFFGHDGDDAVQADRGILISGTQNGDTNEINHVHFYKLSIALEFTNLGAGATNISTFNAQACPIGIKTNAGFIGQNIGIFGSATTDLQIIGPSRVTIQGFSSEGSARMAMLSGATARLEIYGGGWQVGGSGGGVGLAPDGYFIERDNTCDQTALVLENFALQNSNVPYTGPVPKIRLNRISPSGSSQTNVLRNTLGIWAANLDTGSMVGTNDSRNFIFEPSTFAGQQTEIRSRWHGNMDRVADQTWRPWANQDAGQLSVFGGDLNVRALKTPDGQNAAALLGAGATVYSYKVTAETWDGETLATAAFTCTNAAALDATHVNRIRWNQVVGARAYRIYGRTAGAELLMHRLTYDEMHTGIPATDRAIPYWDDDGSIVPAGALPAANTTGNILGEGVISAGVSLKIAGIKVVGAQGALVADAAGGATVDAEARTAINTALARLRAHGLIA